MDALTKSDAAYIRKQKRIFSVLAELRAFAKEAGVDVDTASIDELLEGWRVTMEEAHGKNVQQMKAASKPRDMETFSRLYIPAPEEVKPSDLPPGQIQIVGNAEALMELVEMIEADRRRHLDQSRALELPPPFVDLKREDE